MNAPFVLSRDGIRLADLRDPLECARIDAFLAERDDSSPFHGPKWLRAVAESTGNGASALVDEARGAIRAYLPFNEIHSPIFGRVLASSGFAVGGGLLTEAPDKAEKLFAAARELAERQSCPSIELRGGALPQGRDGWHVQTASHCNFDRELATDEEAELKAIPRKQRAEVRKGLNADLEVRTGTTPADREAHYGVYAESVRNLGTPVFPKSLFDAVLDAFGDAADILTVAHEGKAVASVLSLYHRGTVMPYWGGGTWDARRLRANERMYFELMLHARRRGCTRFDFGRSKTDSGAYYFKKNWGFEPAPLAYAAWTAPGFDPRDANPSSARHRLQVAAWQRLPLRVANGLGPFIARGLG